MMQQIAYANLLDTTRYFKSRKHAFNIKIKEPVQDFPVEIKSSNQSIIYFDLDEMKELPKSHIERIKNPLLKDRIHKFY